MQAGLFDTETMGPARTQLTTVRAEPVEAHAFVHNSTVRQKLNVNKLSNRQR
jgi:hypothetical protein